MWSYYGSKSKVVHLYPTPQHDKIIEPFAGSARYALRYFDRDVLLVDKYEVIVDLWNYLKSASENDIETLPRLNEGDDIRDLKSLSEIERQFLGFMYSTGQMYPAHGVTKFGYIQMRGDGRRDKFKRVASNLHKIRHWTIVHGDYRDIKNETATWFIDSPYQQGGHKYKHNNRSIDFDYLAKWCKSREGQSIVCENTNSSWLPFVPMIKMKGMMKTTTEAIWSNLPTIFDNEQLTIFE